MDGGELASKLRDLAARALAGRRRYAWMGAAAGLALLGTFPLWGGAAAASLARSRIAGRLGVPVRIDQGRAGLGGLELRGLVIGGGGGRAPVAAVTRAHVSYGALWGGGAVRIEGARLHLERGGPGDTLEALAARLRRRAPAAGAPGAPPETGGGGPTFEMRGASLKALDAGRGFGLEVGGLDVVGAPGGELVVHARAIAGTLRVRGGERDPRFGAAVAEARLRLRGLRPAGFPEVTVGDGYVEVLRTLALTGIRGTLRPAARPGDPEAPGHVAVDLAGSYGGARETLWTATGTLTPPTGGRRPKAELHLRAARFSLDKIADILPPHVLEPRDTSIDAALDVGLEEGRVTLRGGLDVSGLSVHHEALASEPLFAVDLGLKVDAALEPGRRRLELARVEGHILNLMGRLSGAVELAPGTFTFKDGSTLAFLPKIELRFEVPRIACARALASLPAPLVPHLQGFALQGNFDADVRTKIDFANLDALELDGKVGINGCRVVKAPEGVDALATAASLEQVVEVPRLDAKTPDEKELLAFTIGPDNPDFVPYDKISPHLVNSIMTTEDSGFFKHRGWVTPEFKTALRRNLLGGGFRLGASSITMQMVKNVLLSREKTLSRKMQELFLVWYIEQLLPKERILELYFNAIEFGPRLYGIGPAVRHYFGKAPADLTPLEAAFFSSILPSPKRRYVQYCHGALSPQWDKYVRRILARVHERGRLGDGEYAEAAMQTLAFDAAGRTMTEKECLDWVKRITVKPEAEPPPEEEERIEPGAAGAAADRRRPGKKERL